MLVALTACGGRGADDSTSTTQRTDSTTTTPEPVSTTAYGTPAAGEEGTEFCETLAADMAALEPVDVTDREALEMRSREGLAAMEDRRGSVPPELEEPYDVLLEGNRAWFALLEEYGWDILAIPVDEPRMLRMTSDERSAAAATVLEYCGIDLLGEEPSDP